MPHLRIQYELEWFLYKADPVYNRTEIWGGIEVAVLFQSIPVSYTHLDVYKRQVYPLY